MARNTKGKIIEGLQIENYAAEGKCIAKYEEKVIFLEYGVPGDIVDIQLTHSKKNWAEGKIINIRKPSDKRIPPTCNHFGVCGGCKWQHIPYTEQSLYKSTQVKDAFERIGKLSFESINPILTPDDIFYYRNKLEFTFSSKKWLTDEEIKSQNEFDRRALGFHIPGKFDKILDIENCYLQKDPSNKIRNSLKEFCIKNDIDFFDIKDKKGFLRNLIIRISNTGDIMVILQVFENNLELINKTISHLSETFPQITSLNYVVNPKMNETFHDLEIICVKGMPFIEEEMENLKFRIGPKTFYQTNSKQAYTLYSKARELAEFTGNELVYDLYTGAGTIANFIAAKVRKVIGIEYVPQAIEDAKKNSEINNISNTAFFAGDMKNVLNDEFINEYGKPDVIITDPPRAGMDEKVIQKLLEINAPKIVYISCNPATQARDLSILSASYVIKTTQPIDMFPQTHHVENIVLLIRK